MDGIYCQEESCKMLGIEQTWSIFLYFFFGSKLNGAAKNAKVLFRYSCLPNAWGVFLENSNSLNLLSICSLRNDNVIHGKDQTGMWSTLKMGLLLLSGYRILQKCPHCPKFIWFFTKLRNILNDLTTEDLEGTKSYISLSTVHLIYVQTFGGWTYTVFFCSSKVIANVFKIWMETKI